MINANHNDPNFQQYYSLPDHTTIERISRYQLQRVETVRKIRFIRGRQGGGKGEGEEYKLETKRGKSRAETSLRELTQMGVLLPSRAALRKLFGDICDA